MLSCTFRASQLVRSPEPPNGINANNTLSSYDVVSKGVDPSFRSQVTLRSPKFRLVQAASHISPISSQACQRTRRTLGTSAAVQQSEAASSEQGSASSASKVDWEAFDAQQRETPRLSHAEEARLLLDSGR